ncbi:MAG TPA: hypothetical protein PK294_11585 [Ignavibacteria bacterium]|nr:hypothetical protein [Ignavibacteria bacterium]HQY52264.1 hypothetical protein [Ignavibacteria bacterium]HRB01069.1 hypothetical protein [Ignavibacteria bacterium]
MVDNIIIYAGIGFAAAIIISLLIKFLFAKNVETINMTSDLRANFHKGKSLQEQVRSMSDAGNRNDAVEILKNSGKLNNEQSQKLMELIGKLGGNNNTSANAGGNELLEKVKNLLRENKKIEAIKLMKESGIGSLKDAKDIVDKIESTGT